MKSTIILTVTFASVACSSFGQLGRTLDWPTFAADPQRSGWEKSDARFNKDTVARDFKFLWKMKATPARKGPVTLKPPVIIGNLIGSRGFKELAFIAGSDDSLRVWDADLNRLYWDRHFEFSGDQTRTAPATCAPSMSTTLLPLALRRPAPRPPVPAAGGGTAVAAAPPRSPNPAFQPRAIFVISSDGRLHRVNVDNGADAGAAVQALPAHARVSMLNPNDGVIYGTTNSGCGTEESTLWAIDISDPAQPKVSSKKLGMAPLAGISGPVIGTDGTVYVQTAERLMAFAPHELSPKAIFSSLSGSVPADASPVSMLCHGKELIAAAGRDGRIHLIEPAGSVIASSEIVPDGVVTGALSTWEDETARWLLAPVWNAKGGSVVVYKVIEQNGKPAFEKAWTSRELSQPMPPVIASGVVFVLSNDEKRAKLYALDATTGKELWSTGDTVTARSAQTGLTVANGRVYFATVDGTIWVFGVPLEI